MCYVKRAKYNIIAVHLQYTTRSSEIRDGKYKVVRTDTDDSNSRQPS